MEQKVLVSTVIGHVYLTVKNDEKAARKLCLLNQFTPQVGDLVCTYMNQDRTKYEYKPILATTLGSYLLDDGQGVRYHHPEDLSIMDETDQMHAVSVFRDTPFEWYVVETESGKTRYMVTRPGTNQGSYDVFDENFDHLVNVDVSAVDTGLMDEIDKVLGTVGERFKTWIRVIVDNDRAIEEDYAIDLSPGD